MRRPIYETETDRTKEWQTAQQIACIWKAKAQQMPRLYPCDVALLRGNTIAAWAEIKHRKNKAADFDTYLLDLQKYRELSALEADTALPVFLIVRWACGTLAFHKITQARNYRVWFGGRTDRGDTQDQQPLLEIPMTEFETIDTHEKNGYFAR